MNWYLAAFKKYATFAGRARRKEFWMFHLIHFIICIPLVVADFMVSVPLLSQFDLHINLDSGNIGPLLGIYLVISLGPSISVLIRRLHDTGRSRAWILINLIPLIGPIAFIVICCLDSQPGENKYGPNPKEINAE